MCFVKRNLGGHDHLRRSILAAAGFSYSVTTDHYVSSDDFRSATEAEATAVMDKYTHETLAFTPFVV